MCKFTYLGYRDCEEPDRHYFIRREKCTTKAHLKHWCAPHEQEESTLAEDEDIIDLPCPMCADVPIVFDQPLLEIAHSRRSVLPAPYYDAATGKYSRHPRHHAHNMSSSKEVPAPLMPKPLNMARVQFDRSASESAVNRIKQREQLPEYKLPSTTYNPTEQDFLLLPATSYQPSTREGKLPKPLPMPQPTTITPPSSREGSLSPPQSRMHGVIRTLPPGESSRRELDSLRERAKAAAAKDERPSAPSSRAATDRSRSGSESSTSSFGNVMPRPPPPPPRRTPSRKPSVASSTASSAVTSSPPSKSSSVSSRNERRPEHRRKESTSTNASIGTSTTHTPPSEATSDSFADRVKDSALRSIGFGGDRNDRTASPERGRRLYRRDRLGSSSERSDSPSIWRPTISPPQLQQDSLGMARDTEVVQSFKQRLVPFAPHSKASKPSTPSGEPAVQPDSAPEKLTSRPKTPHPNADEKTAAVLRLYPSNAEDEKVAMAAFSKMFQEEQRVLIAARQGLPAEVPKLATQGATATEAKGGAEDAVGSRTIGQTAPQESSASTASISMADVGRSMAKVLPAAPTGLRRIKTGQVKTVTVAPPRPPKRANTSDVVGAAAGAPAVKVKTGPLFRFANVGGAKAQEFEIVSGGPDGAGQAF
ncbi:hypothetical protein N0V93_008088 [Gnomoniopsis smithogilvyi]|uniref:Uncharacterized protein n=1 Tax=Gnomoniopsis smithogilvyi TaxID=1191159 RepID=A0A9W9CTJ8_9PEZI|nr:hypothetical protein N0V93_008088 [Gnomoniopsis smithogilvyi]